MVSENHDGQHHNDCDERESAGSERLRNRCVERRFHVEVRWNGAPRLQRDEERLEDARCREDTQQQRTRSIPDGQERHNQRDVDQRQAE